jgi:hypothetical protein
MGYFMNIGPFPMGGSIGTVNPQPYRLSNPWGGYHGASLRYIIDLSNMKNSRRVIPAGISGNFIYEPPLRRPGGAVAHRKVSAICIG